MRQTEYTFASYQSYLKFLRDKTTLASYATKIADHEREHATCARRLGYKAVYGARVVSNDFPHIFLEGFVHFPGREPTREHLIEILLAPKKPSMNDKRLARKLQKEVA